MILSDTSPTAAELGIFIFCLMGAAQLALVILQIATFNKAAKREVTILPNAVTKEEFAALKERVEWLNRENTKVWEKMERDARSIERTVSAVSERLSAVAEKSQMICDQAGLISIRLDNITRP